MKHFEKHLSFASVIACLALFVALGGSAVAVTAMLPQKSVKTKHLAQGVVTTTKLRNGAVTTAKIRNGAVTAQKIGAGAVGSAQLLDGSVRSGDLGGGVVTTGKLKDGAVTDAKLSTSLGLLSNMQYVVQTSVSSSEGKSETAQCPAGKQVIGGGARVVDADAKVALTGSAPVINGGGKWTASAAEVGEEPAAWSIEVIAVCAEI